MSWASNALDYEFLKQFKFQTQSPQKALYLLSILLHIICMMQVSHMLPNARPNTKDTASL